MKTIPPRVPDGGAIEDSQEMNMEAYSATMKKALGAECRRFVEHVVRQVRTIPRNDWAVTVDFLDVAIGT